MNVHRQLLQELMQGKPCPPATLLWGPNSALLTSKCMCAHTRLCHARTHTTRIRSKIFCILNKPTGPLSVWKWGIKGQKSSMGSCWWIRCLWLSRAEWTLTTHGEEGRVASPSSCNVEGWAGQVLEASLSSRVFSVGGWHTWVKAAWAATGRHTLVSLPWLSPFSNGK